MENPNIQLLLLLYSPIIRELILKSLKKATQWDLTIFRKIKAGISTLQP
jgi:hypothetical protein